MTDDAHLLSSYVQERSEAAFASVVGRHVNLVYRAALRQLGGNEHAARDVAQQVFTLLARKAPGLAGHPNLAGWLYAATYRIAAQERRTERRRQIHAVHFAAMTSPDRQETSDQVDWARIQPALDAAMHELRARDRDALLMRYFEQRSFAEVGRSLLLTEDAARMRVDRALDKLRLILARRGVSSSAAAVSLGLAKDAALAAPAGLAGAVVTGALADAGALAGTGLSLFHLMSTSKILVGSASIVALVAVGVALNAHIAAERATAAANLAVRERNSMRRQLQQAEVNAPLPETVAAAVPAAPPPPAAAEAVPLPPAPDPESELVALADFRNVGRSTPGAAFQTVIWAAVNDRQRILTDSLDVVGPARRALDELWASLTEGERTRAGRPERLIALAVASEMQRFGRMQVLEATQDLPEDERQKLRAQRAIESHEAAKAAGALTHLGIRVETVTPDPDSGASTSQTLYQMWQEDGEWRLVVHPNMVPSVRNAQRALGSLQPPPQ